MFNVFRCHEDAILPKRAEEGSAGYDVCCLEDFTLNSDKPYMVPTGLIAQVPQEYYIRIAPRSGLALKDIDVLAGVVDSSYRDEIKVVLRNHGAPFAFKKGDRIAQFIIQPIVTPPVTEVFNSSDLCETDRKGGFGSTGLSSISSIL